MQRTKDGAIIGQAGIKYGLQKPGVKKPAAAVAQQRPNVFGDDDSDDDVEAQVARQAEKKRSAKKVQQVYEQALAEDPTVFDYDGVYDSIQAERVQPKQQEKLARQSKYIAQLKEQAEHRKREEEIRFERRLLKERTAEDALYEGKEKFVTSAYRKKLEEDQKWMEQQKLKDLEDEKRDVTKVGHLGNFYSNLLTKNVAMGAKRKEDAAEKQQSEEGAEGSEGGDGAAKPVVAAGKAPVLDKYEQLRLEAERARREAAAAGRSSSGDGGDQQGPGAASPSAGHPQQHSAPVQQGQEQGPGESAGDAGGAPPVAEEGGQQTGQTKAGVAAGKRRNDDESVMSARERYLARKKQAVS